MEAIQTLMAADHRRCDEIFARAEQFVAEDDLAAALLAFAEFGRVTREHFACEEKLLFPAFEERSGMRFGPTEVMRQEHRQMVDLMQAAEQALADGDADGYCGEVETLLVLMQQHNMKEENILYPMCDRHFGAEAENFAQTLSAALHPEEARA